MKYDNEKDYKEAIYSYMISSKQIMKEIKIPKSVFKYRSFGKLVDGKVDDSGTFWKESLDGKFHFSNPGEFNKNDENDCVLKIDEIKALEIIYGQSYEKLKRSPKQLEELMKAIADIKGSFRERVRVGCFTGCDYTNKFMWDQDLFSGPKNTGYCIEYNVYEELFYPGTIIFLKVLYDDIRYDATKSYAYTIIGNSKFELIKTRNKQKIDFLGMGINTVYNSTLIKPHQYTNENEWRIIIPINRFEKYFGNSTVNCNKDFSSAMKAIYLGSEYKALDPNNEKYEYAYNTCKRLQIALYIMEEKEGQLHRKCIYDPEG
jgi:hypothetical protein